MQIWTIKKFTLPEQILILQSHLFCHLKNTSILDCPKILLSCTKLTLSKTTNFRPFQTERVADDNTEFDEKRKKLSKRVENEVGKGEIAHNTQFLFFPQCFQKTCSADM